MMIMKNTFLGRVFEFFKMAAGGRLGFQKYQVLQFEIFALSFTHVYFNHRSNEWREISFFRFYFENPIWPPIEILKIISKLKIDTRNDICNLKTSGKDVLHSLIG